jgi:hypothetical protein
MRQKEKCIRGLRLQSILLFLSHIIHFSYVAAFSDEWPDARFALDGLFYGGSPIPVGR